MFLSIGQDGNFFVYSYMSPKDLEAEMLKAKIPSAHKLAEDQKLPDDIDDPQAYRCVISPATAVKSAIRL